VRSDPDSSVPSDLPYACSAGYSNNIEDFIGATRVITRLPDIKGDADPENAAKLISSVTSAQPQSGIFYRNYFGVSAEVWSISTRLSLINVFGNASMQQDVPSAGSPWPVSELSRPSHFFNCHGAPADPKWYGQSKINPDDYPVANETRSMLGEISPATVVAAECCYGAQLYDPSLAGGQLPLCNAYLQSGACAFWGSSTIAYGPAASNDNADLICQYFFKELLNGASIGRAALIARQTYARKTLTLSPVDLKTLAQFLIYGDSSTVCVVAKTVGELSMKAVGTEARALESEIKQRRAHLLVDGEQLQRSRAITLLPIQTEDRVLEKIRALARDFGISEPQVQSLRVQRAMGAGVGAGPFDLTIEKAFEATGISEFHILADIRPGSEKQSFKLLEVAASNEDIIFVRELFSR
jgi:hypothetical protein